MVQRTLTVTNEHGLHARPATEFVRTASGFSSTVTIRNLSKGGRAVNAKSITQLLIAGVDRGSEIELTADGEDAEEAVAALTDLLENQTS